MFNRPRFEPATASRLGRVALAALTVLAAVAAVLVIVPSNAQALPGLDRKYDESDNGLASVKVAFARCPSGKQIVGGGGIIRDGGEDFARFIELRPIEASPDGFFAAAQTVFNAQRDQWTVAAYAVCADADTKVVSYEVENPNSHRYVQGWVGCPGNSKALSAGGAIRYFGPDRYGRIGLQMIRTSNPMDIARATARENTPLDTPNPWSLRVYAVCGNPPATDELHVEGEGDPDGNLEAKSSCAFVHGPGGGASGPGISDAGPSWLKAIRVDDLLLTVTVTMAGYDPPIGGVVAHHTCAKTQ
jgi:hypothetical protein